MLTYTAPGGRWLVGGACSNGGNVVDWLLRRLDDDPEPTPSVAGRLDDALAGGAGG